MTPAFNRCGAAARLVALMLFAAAAGLVLASLGQTEKPPVTIAFVNFGQAGITYGKGVVLRVVNTSDKPFPYFYDSCELMPHGNFVSQSSTGLVVEPHRVIGPTVRMWLAPGQSTNVTVSLPEDGRTGRVAIVHAVEAPNPRPPGWMFPRVECDQELVCPKRLPNGTVEPPRLLLVPERQP